MYLAHYELESDFIIIIITTVPFFVWSRVQSDVLCCPQYDEKMLSVGDFCR